MKDLYVIRIKDELKKEGYSVTNNAIKKILNSFLQNTMNGLLSHKIIDWIYFRFTYDLVRLRKSCEFYPDKYKTKHFKKPKLL